MNQQSKNKMQWYRVDLHLHTPGSGDYQEPNATYLDILQQAEKRGLDIIALTDHNTVRGYDNMIQEVQQLELLVKLNRAQPEEKRRLAEYQRLLNKILVLPGFEFTATFGFHILGIFSPQSRVRQVEHILLKLNIPPQVLEEGNSNVGASSDVLTAYREINNAGGLVIAAHVNSAHGVAMRGLDFGGQTKIAYTQDPHLHALEVTDLERRGRGATASFFNGTKTEYPRRMHCIQGSDAHRITKDPRSDKNLGVGDRVTEVMLPEKSFEALKDVFRGNDFGRTRPYRSTGKEFYDPVQVAREAGPNVTQAFYDSVDTRSGKLYAALADICAFANTNGGTLYVGVAPDVTIPVMGVDRIGDVIQALQENVASLINPALKIKVDTLETHEKRIVQVQVPRGSDQPYAVEGNRIYVREEAETVLAGRDALIRLVQRIAPPAPATAESGRKQKQEPRHERRHAPKQAAPAPVEPVAVEAPPAPEPVIEVPADVPVASVEAPAAPAKSGRGRRKRGAAAQTETPAAPEAAPAEVQAELAPAVSAEPPPLPQAEAAEPPSQPPSAPEDKTIRPPRNGVEIVGVETRKGEQYHVMRDLRNNNLVRNVTKNSARRLWYYAILERENNPVDSGRVQWSGQVGLWKRYRRGDAIRHDLVMRDNGKPMRVFYGVTADGMPGIWKQFVSDAEPDVVIPDEE